MVVRLVYQEQEIFLCAQFIQFLITSGLIQTCGFRAPLVAGYGPPPMIWGAEILRYQFVARDSGYTADIQQFESWLNNVY